jgi:transcriptional regulator with XRE-family HTH domain
MSLTESNSVALLLAQLGMSQADVARQLGVSDRTVRRWVGNPASAPGPALTYLRRLALTRIMRRWGLPAEIDYLEGRSAFGELAAEDMARELEWATELDGALSRVKARGGPRQRWRVLIRVGGGVATLGDRKVSFHRNRSGGFSLQLSNNIARLELIEDAAWSFAHALSKQGWPSSKSENTPLGSWFVSLSRSGPDFDDALQSVRKRGARAAKFD